MSDAAGCSEQEDKRSMCSPDYQCSQASWMPTCWVSTTTVGAAGGEGAGGGAGAY